MSTTIRKLFRSVMVAAALTGVGTMACAQSKWPTGPIRVVVPFGAGGDTDYNARVLSKYLEPELGVSMPVVNVSGAGGSIGARQVLGAKPDGQTVLFFHSAMLVNTASGVADFSWRDFELSSIAGREAGSALIVKADAPWKTLDELVDATKADPDSIDLTTNTGATTYLVGALLNKAGARFNFVDVGGSASRLAAVLGGNVAVSQNPVGQVKPYLDKGELRALGVFSPERSEALPDVPTVKEQGYDVVFQYGYFYLFPKGTPQEVVSKFTGAVKSIVEGNADYGKEIEKTYGQKPFFLEGDAAVDYLTETEQVVDSVEF